MREFGSEHPAISLPDGYFDNLKKLGREITYLRSGREALLYVAMNIAQRCSLLKVDGQKCILFPAYCCWSMSAPFEKSGWNIIYYKLNEDLTVDEEYLKQLLLTEKPDAILSMNFYGSACTDVAVSIAKDLCPHILTIEDFSHCTFSIKQIFNHNVDFYVSSIRKSIGVCDGAIVISKQATNRQYIDSAVVDFADRRFEAQMDKGRYTFTKDTDSKNSFLRELCECERLINEFNAVRPISDRAMKMLSLVNGEEIVFARRENMKHLMRLLEDKVKMVIGLDRSWHYAPFSLPILVENRDNVQMLLAQNGVYAPVLWPICNAAREICPNSAYVADHMLSIPIDQRYDWDDIEKIAEIVSHCTK